MGATREVRIFKRLDAYRDEPFATSRRDMMRRLADPGHEGEAFCPSCRAVVEPCGINAVGGAACPFCGMTTLRPKTAIYQQTEQDAD